MSIWQREINSIVKSYVESDVALGSKNLTTFAAAASAVRACGAGEQRLKAPAAAAAAAAAAAKIEK